MRRVVVRATHGVRAVLQSLRNGFDIAQNIDALQKPGDSYLILIRADAHVEAGGYVEGQFTAVRGEGGAYTLNVEADAGPGLWPALGGALGGRVGLGGFGLIGSGGNAELTFASADEAKRAIHIVLHQFAGTTARGLARRALAGRLFAPSREDLRFLADHLTGVDLRGMTADDLFGALGLTSNFHGFQAGLCGGAEVNASQILKLELAKGVAKGLVITHSLSGVIQAGAGVGFGTGPDTPLMIPLLDGNLQATVTLRSRFALPQAASTSETLRDPVGVLARNARAIRASGHTELLVDLTGFSGGVLTRGVDLHASLGADVEALLSSGILARLFRGDIHGALSLAKRSATFSAAAVPFVQTGVGVGPSFDLLGVGFDALVQTARTNNHNPLWSYPGGAEEAVIFPTAGSVWAMETPVPSGSENPEPAVLALPPENSG